VPKHLKFAVPACLLLTVASGPALATNGYFQHAYGAKSAGQAGLGYAHTGDTIGMASNPAGAYALGNRWDAGIDWFSPDRGYAIENNDFGPDSSGGGNGRRNFYIPSGGYAHRVADRYALGIVAYGNGGLNTDYRSNPYARFGATGDAGVDLQQLIVSPTAAMQVLPGLVVGASVNIAYQLFEAKGLGLFSGFSQSPGAVSDNNYDDAFGVGFRIGMQGEITPWLSAGATWQSRTWMQRFSKYAGLFADNGNLDIPSTWGVGIAVKPIRTLRLGFDVQRIEYASVNSIGNSASLLFSAGRPLGSAGGPGFGWRDVTAFKFGGEFQVTPTVALRAGYSYARQPVPQQETFFNILAPGLVEHHFTIGSTWAVNDRIELSLFALHAPTKRVNGENSIPPGNPPAGLGGGNANLRLREDAIGMAFGYRFGGN
jgi:long-chain fatty acid transport protein